ncbi:MAG: acetate--CoA ligase family protein, partial [Salana multivorans]|nr:acetate--CoA ligase family protein [Salana multivorans]
LADRLESEPDLEPLEDVIARVAEAIEAIPQLRALELTPALATEEGILVLSARVSVAPQIRPDGGRRALRPAVR